MNQRAAGSSASARDALGQRARWRRRRITPSPPTPGAPVGERADQARPSGRARRRGRRAARSRSACRDPWSRAGSGRPRAVMSPGYGVAPGRRWRGPASPASAAATSVERPRRPGPGRCASSQCTRGSRPNQPICLRASRRVPAAIAARASSARELAAQHARAPRRSPTARDAVRPSPCSREALDLRRPARAPTSASTRAVDPLVEHARGRSPGRSAPPAPRRRAAGRLAEYGPPGELDDLERAHDPPRVARADRRRRRPGRAAASSACSARDPSASTRASSRARTSGSVPGNSMWSSSARTYSPEPPTATARRAAPVDLVERGARARLVVGDRRVLVRRRARRAGGAARPGARRR